MLLLQIKSLETAGFESIHLYSESHAYSFPLSYLVAFKKYHSRANWYRNIPELELEIHRRITSSLTHLDAASIAGYQLPSKKQETEYCISSSECDEYRVIDPTIVNIPLGHIEAHKSTVENAGRGLYAGQDIPKGAVLDMSSSVKCKKIFSARVIRTIYCYLWSHHITLVIQHFT